MIEDQIKDLIKEKEAEGLEPSEIKKVLSEEFKDKGPAFNALALGAVQTEMLEEAFTA